MQGLKLAIIYGIKPHELGFCGPRDTNKDLLIKYLKGDKSDEKKVRNILKGFEAAYSYLKLIASINKIKDPFNEKVVRAYWTGNNLLDKIKVSDLQKMIVKDFSKKGLLPKIIAKEKANLVPINSKPHHSFHVFIIGSITGRIRLVERLMDICRIGWGRVKKISNNKLIVDYQPIIKKKKFELSKLTKKTIDWDKNLMLQPKKGDWVSFHWNRAVEVLNEEDKKNLIKYTKMTINSLNSID
ncbi:MAG: DUF6390 family protein [Patescibacteria group bacterium]